MAINNFTLLMGHEQRKSCGNGWRLVVVVGLAYFLTLSGHLYSPDEEIMFRTTQSLARHGSLAIEPLLAVPFYYAGEVLDAALPKGVKERFMLPTTQYHGGTAREFVLRFAVSLFNPIVGVIFAVFFFGASLYLTGDQRAAYLSALLLSLGTLCWVHCRTFFSEPLAAFLVFAALFFLYRGMREKRGWLVLAAGGVYGYALLVRLDSLICLPGLVVLMVLENWREAKLTPGLGRGAAGFLRAQWSGRRSYAFLLPVGISILVLLLVNWIKFGSPLATGYEDQPEGIQFSTPLLAGLYGFLFSVGKGLFFFSPVLVLFFFGVRSCWGRHRELTIAALTIVVLFLCVQAQWRNWSGGWCWGPRHIFLLHPLLALCIGFFLLSPLSRLRRVVYLLLLLIGIGVQLYGSSQSFIDYYLEYFRTPTTSPNAYVLYSPEEREVLDRFYQLYVTQPGGEQGPQIPLQLLIAPMQDSLFVPQNSQWYAYKEMWQEGRHDFFWLHFLFPQSWQPQGKK